MGDGRRLVRAMQQAAKIKDNEVTDIIVGLVTSINPLRIRINTVELSSSFLILGALCKETNITTAAVQVSAHSHSVPAHDTQTADAHSHSVLASVTGSNSSTIVNIQLWRGLQINDEVLMLKCGAGQKYYVLQRKEGIV